MSYCDDYYQILGVLRSAKLAEITAAYHALAHQCHPDAGAADADSLAKFKLIAEAYEVLSDESKREDYDRRTGRLTSTMVNSSFGSQTPSKFVDLDLSQSPASPPRAANDVDVELPIAPEEARFGGPCCFTLSVMSDCRCCEGRGLMSENACQACGGTGRSRERRRLEVMLPQGAQSGTVIRMAGQGRQSATSAGDLFVRLCVQPCW